VSKTEKIYIGNLPYQITDEEIKAFFVGFEVSNIKIVTDKETGRSKGFGFLEVSGDAAAAIAAFNGKDLGGRTIRVNEAIDKPRVAKHLPAEKVPTPTPKQAQEKEEYAEPWKQPTLASARRK
jgi:RNA recognition motif-containing protein